jgi:hypothetical protein
MTANLIAKVVQSQYEKLNVDELLSEFKGIEKYKYGRLSDEWVNKHIDNEQYHRWIDACYLLETYLKRHFQTFVETELVYTWAKDICEQRNKYLNKRRMGYN